jgi:predicted transcriptional regulator
MLRIAKNLELPNEAVTQTFAILAKRGVGKTYTANVFAEEMLKAALQVVVVDPIGVWWGLRSAADGKGPGLSILIAGGDHADVPIEPTNGEVLANLVVNEGVSVVIDLSLFRKGEQVRFMTDFAETLYHRNRSALHLIVDEADAFAPQRPIKGQERMLGAMEDIVRRGRARGIGVTLITQRPAVLHKDVLTQIEVLVPMRLIAPQDRNAIDAWVQVHGEPGQREELMQSLPSLPIGTAWFWSPGWLDIFKRVEVRKRETFDSSSTPEVGKKLKSAKMADVDLDKVREQLAATIEKTQANDPITLKRKIVELERELQQKPQANEVTRVEQHAVMSMDQVKQLTEAAYSLIKQMEKFAPITVADKIDDLDAAFEVSHDEYGTSKRVPFHVSPAVPDNTAVFVGKDIQTGKPKIVGQISSDDGPKITGGAKRMLEVLFSRHPMTFTRSQLATLSKMSPRSGTYGTYLSTLRSAGLIEQDGDTISLTTEGMKFFGGIKPTPQTTDEVIDMWRGNLTGGARRMFDVLVENYPKNLSREELGQAADISYTSGTFGTYLSMLAGNGLIERDNQHIKAADALFIGA